MNESIAMCCNVYNDVGPLRGLLETSSRYFDNLFVVNSGPGGAKSTDGTIELCEQFGATIVFDDMNRGFGAIRSRLIHDCGCTFAFILDADERFIPQLPIMHCEGVERYPVNPKPNLSVFHKNEVCNQGQLLRQIIQDSTVMAVKTHRRHWMDFSMKQACENWLLIKDPQLRIVRNHPEIGYETGKVMHERLLDHRTKQDPKHYEPDAYQGPFHDHFHMAFRKAKPGYKEAREREYQKLERGETMTAENMDNFQQA